MSKYKNQQAIDEFRVHVNGLNRMFPPNDGRGTPVAYFGYKTRRGDEIFTVVDWGNIEQFLDEQLTKKEEEVRMDIYYDLMTARNAIMQVLGKSLKTKI